MFFRMKHVLIGLTLLLANMSVANADPAQVLANICTIVQSDDKSGLRKKVKTMKKDYGLKLAAYYDGISCGGLTLIRYAIKNGSMEAGKFLIKKMSKKALRAPQKDSVTELDWANANHADAPLTAVLAERVG
ncbi:MAG: DUF3718 domain-containing protein [Alteromonadaceae bacterium]|nr:DUF3718 domain-containing protein [Alteromonadaceae bacterium]